MLALKLTLVPLFLSIVSLSGRWWGPTVAGWLAALPVVAGPILYLIVLQNGPAFGARAAAMALAAILASEAFNFAYAWICRMRAWPIALAAGLCAWFAAAAALSLLPASLPYGTLAAVCAVAFAQTFLPRNDEAPRAMAVGKRDLTGRMAAGALLTLAVTTASARLGPAWSGLLAVFPLLSCVLAVSSQRAYGAPYVVALFRGMVAGRLSFGAFCVYLALALPRLAPTTAFVEAAVVAVLAQWATKRFTTAAARLARPRDA